jgi:hypothetical protein
MTVQEMEVKKVKLISMITSLYDDNLIQQLEKILLAAEKDWWNIIDDKERKAIQEGLLDYKKGNLVENDVVLNGARRIIQG